jgi:hypothetical protein
MFSCVCTFVCEEMSLCKFLIVGSSIFRLTIENSINFLKELISVILNIFTCLQSFWRTKLRDLYPSYITNECNNKKCFSKSSIFRILNLISMNFGPATTEMKNNDNSKNERDFMHEYTKQSRVYLLYYFLKLKLFLLFPVYSTTQINPYLVFLFPFFLSFPSVGFLLHQNNKLPLMITFSINGFNALSLSFFLYFYIYTYTQTRLFTSIYAITIAVAYLIC